MPRLGRNRPSRRRFRQRLNSSRTEIHTLRQRRQAIRNLFSRQNSVTVQLPQEVTYPAPMTSQQIKRSIEARAETNQDVKFLAKKQCAVCLSSWKEILLGENHLVFTQCGHVFCRPCALRIASEGRRECAMCKRSFAGVTPPFRRLHLPLDPKLNKNNAV